MTPLVFCFGALYMILGLIKCSWEALGEAGIVHSKLAPMDFAQSDIHSSYDLQGRFNFSPERYNQTMFSVQISTAAM